jgi:hypothetical protein
MFGWKKMTQALCYFNESAEDMAKLLQTPTAHNDGPVSQGPTAEGKPHPRLTLVQVAKAG